MERTHPEAKALPYHKEYEAHEKAVLQGCAEAILINTRNEVTEGAYSNVFWMKDGVLFTRENDVLQGITRAKVIENAKKESIPFQFAIITKEELLTMDEVFITSSLRGIVPVAEIDGVKIGEGGAKRQDYLSSFIKR
jgi:branched-subunit amino acid aminotransferase/4-amino-4-deoxychorismate lyase